MRPPLTIWLFCSAELWRLILLTTGVVVILVAFCATVKPMAEGKLGSGEAARFLLYAIPPMLQYVLPFAAGFASTIAFHRMAADNELDAARFGGISYKMLLAPAAAAGLALAIGLAVLTGEIVPRFLRSMEEIIRQDVTRILVNSVERGESVRFDDLLVYADRVYRLGPDEQAGAYEVLVLTRFAAIALQKDGKVRGGVTAARAWIWLRRAPDSAVTGESATLVTIKLENWSGDLPELRGTFQESWISRRIPSPFRDDVKFMTWKELRALPANPDLHAHVDSRRRVLAYAIARQDTVAAIHADLKSQFRASLRTGSASVLLRGSGLVPQDVRRDGQPPERRWAVAPSAPGGVVEVEAIDGGGLDRLTAQSAYFTHASSDDHLDPRPTLNLHLVGVRILGSVEGVAPEAPSREYRALTPAVDPADALLATPSRALLEEARARLARNPDPEIADAERVLRLRLRRLGHEVIGRVHERAAMAVSCLIMVLTGSVIAIRLKDSLPVPVYLWSFFPGIGAVLTVNAGKEMVRSLGEPGLIILWGGLALLAAYTALMYAAIRRH